MGQSIADVSLEEAGVVVQETKAKDAEGVTSGQPVPSTNGISQSLLLFGKSFHLQTEICDGKLRTEIFDGGRVVATRKAQLDPQADCRTLQVLMHEFHQEILSGVLERASRYQADREEGRAPRDRRARSLGKDSQVLLRSNQGAVESGLQVRRLLGNFRAFIVDCQGSVAERLDCAASAIHDVLSSALFEQIRIDEQLRFHVLQDQIKAWKIEGQGHREASDLWQDLENFAAYLAGIENRAEFSAEPLSVSQKPRLDSDRRVAPKTPPPSKKENRNGKIRVFPNSLPGSSHSSTADSQWEKIMAQVSLEPLTAIDGFVGACLVDSDSGMMLGAHGGGSVNLELAAAGNTQVVRAKRKTMASLKLNDRIEDILISLKTQYHLIRILESNPAIFLYLVLERERANLAMARMELRSFEKGLNLS